MGLRDIGATLPPGFRFYPSDEELVCHYLYKKIVNEQVLKGTLVEIDLHTCEPWQLPEVAKLNANEWYFFSFRDLKYATGFRTNRATTTGYWKATGKDRMVVDPKTEMVVGMRKTLVFYRNRAPNGIKTGWIMHEFRLHTPHMPPKEEWVLCRVFHKSKEENITKLSSAPMLETSSNDHTTYQNISSLSAAAPTYQSNAQCWLNLLQYNSHRENNSNEVTSKVDDGGYDDFLWGMEENSLGSFGFRGHETWG
ncbi:hypothetical protein HRI_000313100 [Hibiscus trionum]|uniref:NAC domain-containing protein n=1 Tax=Hibiscus trionum TaxID=183268 RepID=A0A9W7LIU5_HIBTR|nr:hypothetical protein HRI_000313100 [Hibiscus trionum]